MFPYIFQWFIIIIIIIIIIKQEEFLINNINININIMDMKRHILIFFLKKLSMLVDTEERNEIVRFSYDLQINSS